VNLAFFEKKNELFRVKIKKEIEI